MNCKTCGGSGMAQGTLDPIADCPACDGTGKAKPEYISNCHDAKCVPVKDYYICDVCDMPCNRVAKPAQTSEQYCPTHKTNHVITIDCWNKPEAAHEHIFVVPVEAAYTYIGALSRSGDVKLRANGVPFDHMSVTKLRCSGCPEEVERT